MKNLLLLLGLSTWACGDDLVDGDTSIELAIDEISALQVPSRGGIEVVLAGKNFASDVRVTIGEVPVLSLAWKSDHLLTFVAPPLPHGPKTLRITNPNGQSVESAVPIRYYAEVLDFVYETVIAPLSPDLPFSVGDVTGDGLDDLLVEVYSYNELGQYGCIEKVFSGDGRGNFEFRYEVPWHELWYSERLLIDVNADGLDDEVYHAGQVRLAGPDGLGPAIDLNRSDYDDRDLVGDFDGNGRNEILDLTWFADGSFIYELHDDGRIAMRAPAFAGCGGPWSCTGWWLALTAPWLPRDAVGDFNADGKDDVALVGNDRKLHLLAGPTLHEYAAVQLPESLAWQNSSVQDFDHDGREDLLLVGSDGQGYMFKPDSEGGMALPEQTIPLCPGSSEHNMMASTKRSWTRDPKRAATIKMSCDDQLWVWIDGQPVKGAKTRGKQFADFNGDSHADMVAGDFQNLTALLATEDQRFAGIPWFDVADPSLGEVPQIATFATPRTSAAGPRALVAGSGQLLWIWRDNGKSAGFESILRVPDPSNDVIQSMFACDRDGDGQDEVAIVMGNAYHSPDTTKLFIATPDRESWSIAAAGEFPSMTHQYIPLTVAGQCEAIWLSFDTQTLRHTDATFWRADRAGFEVALRDLSKLGLNFSKKKTFADMNDDGVTDLLYGDEIFVDHGNYDFVATSLKTSGFSGYLGAWSSRFFRDQQSLAMLLSDGNTLVRARLHANLQWNIVDSISFPHAIGDPQWVDMNGDGLPDLAVRAHYPAVTVAPSNSAGGFTLKPEALYLDDSDLPTPWYQTRFFDADADGLSDIFYTRWESPTHVSLIRNQSF